MRQQRPYCADVGRVGSKLRVSLKLLLTVLPSSLVCPVYASIEEVLEGSQHQDEAEDNVTTLRADTPAKGGKTVIFFDQGNDQRKVSQKSNSPGSLFVLGKYVQAEVDKLIDHEYITPQGLKPYRATKKGCRLTKDGRKLVETCQDKQIYRLGERKYHFIYNRVGPYLVIPHAVTEWALCDREGNNVCTFGLLAAETEKNVTWLALAKRDYWGVDTDDEPSTDAHREGNACFICSKGMLRHPDKSEEIYERIDTYIQEGIAVSEIKWAKSHPLKSVEAQKAIISELLTLVRSEKEQTEDRDFLKQAMEKRQERRNREKDALLLRREPGYKMEKEIGSQYKKTLSLKELPEGNKGYKNPEKMWNRPSLQWFGQFQKSLLDHANNSWNERGDSLRFLVSRTEKSSTFECRVSIAHTISEYDALRFLEGLTLDDVWYYDTKKVENQFRKRQVDACRLGEHNISLKPQLDAYGALIPNSEESDISFVRNNTAVRVVADRPDVSVLWIARKIDEELIAAGKGEPPTWTPPAKCR